MDLLTLLQIFTNDDFIKSWTSIPFAQGCFEKPYKEITMSLMTDNNNALLRTMMGGDGYCLVKKNSQILAGVWCKLAASWQFTD